MKKLALALSMVLLMCGCGGNAPSTAPPIKVTVNPASPPNIDQGQTLLFSASLTNDTANKGVVWTATGSGCAGAACGTFTNVTATSATYVAPASVTGALGVTVTATAAAAASQSASASFFVMPPPTIVTTDLPNATPNASYTTTLKAAGGVAPLLWSVASGTLPAGLQLNSAGVIFGTPTAGGTSTFTLKVTDSSGAAAGALTTQQTLALTVVGVLTVPAAVLPAGTVGIAYSATLPYTGGTLPLIWSIYSGSLPSGLVLQPSTGVISGTPTVQGTYSFVVQVIDSSPTQQTYTSSPLTMTINPSGPLTIRTSSLLDGAVDVAYQGQLVATGGSPPLSWTVTGGALPSGLALDPSTGVISGAPTAVPGTYSFTVQVADTSAPQETRTQPLSITVDAAPPACSSSGSESLLVGQYAFSLSGYNGDGFLALVGSFTADGTGKITGGEADTNGVLGAQSGSLLTSASSYSVGPDNRGCATFATPFGTFSTRFALGAVSAGVATQGRIIEFDNPGASSFVAAGRILRQNTSAFLTPLTGSYALRTSGWDSSAPGRVSCAGIVIAAQYKFSYLQQDCNDNGTVSNTTTTTPVGTYTTADTQGRGTAILSVGGNLSDVTFYWVSGTQLLVLNSDPNPPFSGEWQQEAVPIGSPGFNQASWNGNGVFYAKGLGLSGAAGDVSFATTAADGLSSVAIQDHRDMGGSWQTTSTTCTYSVVFIGRVTLSGSGCGANPPVGYLISSNTAFLVGTDSSAELGSLEPQTTGLTAASLAGTYFVGTSEVVSQSAQAEVGILTLTSGGQMTMTSDSSSALNQFPDAASSDTYSLNADGTFSTGSSGGTTVGVAISGNKFVLVGDQALTFPTLLVGQR